MRKLYICIYIYIYTYIYGIVAYTFLNVHEKEFTSFCQVLKEMYTKEIGSFFLPHGAHVYTVCRYSRKRVQQLKKRKKVTCF